MFDRYGTNGVNKVITTSALERECVERFHGLMFIQIATHKVRGGDIKKICLSNKIDLPPELADPVFVAAKSVKLPNLTPTVLNESYIDIDI